MAADTKNSKTIKINFFQEPIDIIGYKFDRNINGTLVFKFMKNKKRTQQNKVTVTYFVFTSPIFAQMPISRENVSVFCSDLITMVPK